MDFIRFYFSLNQLLYFMFKLAGFIAFNWCIFFVCLCWYPFFLYAIWCAWYVEWLFAFVCFHFNIGWFPSLWEHAIKKTRSLALTTQFRRIIVRYRTCLSFQMYSSGWSIDRPSLTWMRKISFNVQYAYMKPFKEDSATQDLLRFNQRNWQRISVAAAWPVTRVWHSRSWYPTNAAGNVVRRQRKVSAMVHVASHRSESNRCVWRLILVSRGS